MRIIAGTWKSKRLISPNTEKTRPTLDRVKEAVFSMISKDIPGATVLDLFSGTGNLAIEALSRGAKFCYINDIDNNALKTIFSNIKLTNYEECVKISKKEYAKCIKGLESENISIDLIFLDPPFGAKYESNCLGLISKSSIINGNTKIILETDKDTLFDENIAGLELSAKKIYGRIMIRIYMKGD